MSEGSKFDNGKPDLSLIPAKALTEVATVLGFGALKYGRYNYKEGLAWSRCIAAALRHITSFNDGQDLDLESGKSHIAHAICNLIFLLDYIENHPELDDRYKPCPQKTETEVNLNILEEKSNNSKSLSSSSDEILAEPKKNWINDMTPEQMRTLQLILEGGKLLMPNPTTALSTPLLSF